MSHRATPMAGKYASSGTLLGIFAVFLIAPLLFWGGSEEKEREQRPLSSRQTARPQVQTFKAEAPVDRLSEPIPALSRHCLDWSPAPPYTREDVAVFVKGKPTKTADIPKGGLIVQGAYFQFQSNLEEAVPLNMVRFPMKNRKC